MLEGVGSLSLLNPEIVTSPLRHLVYIIAAFVNHRRLWGCVA